MKGKYAVRVEDGVCSLTALFSGLLHLIVLSAPFEVPLRSAQPIKPLIARPGRVVSHSECPARRDRQVTANGGVWKWAAGVNHPLQHRSLLHVDQIDDTFKFVYTVHGNSAVSLIYCQLVQEARVLQSNISNAAHFQRSGKENGLLPKLRVTKLVCFTIKIANWLNATSYFCHFGVKVIVGIHDCDIIYWGCGRLI